MTLLGLLVYLMIAAIVGTLAQFVVGFGRGGFILAAILGLLGAFVGGWIARQLHLPQMLQVSVQGETIEVVWAFIGAVILMLLLSLLRGPSYFRGRPYWRRG